MHTKIWIDLDNSPHVPFFKPIIDQLRDAGHKVEITARDCFQTCGLADMYGLNYKRIGRHYGKNKILKVAGTVYRSLQLMIFALQSKPTMALSHGSRAQLLAAKVLRIKAVVIADYEHAQGLIVIKPDLLIVPQVVWDNLHKNNNNKIASYPGIKEDVYASLFNPDDKIKEILNLGNDKIIVTIRPPATEAHYHNPDSEILFNEVLEFLGKQDNVQMVILPRNEIKQTAMIKSKWSRFIANGKIVIPEKVVNGLNLIWHSDFVVSGGGTMNREAAALGVPVYSIFRGKIGAVDRYLSQENRLVLLTSKEDVRNKIKVEKRSKEYHKPEGKESKALETIVRLVDNHING